MITFFSHVVTNKYVSNLLRCDGARYTEMPQLHRIMFITLFEKISFQPLRLDVFTERRVTVLHGFQTFRTVTFSYARRI